MSDTEGKDEEANLPSAEECEKRCQEFATVTGTDTALAQFFLQDRDWDVQKSLNAYFESQGGPDKPTEADSKGDDSVTMETASAAAAAGVPKEEADPEPHRIRLMTWNIDGLDEHSLKARMNAVCNTILRENPDVVYLQEVISPMLGLLEKKCPAYQVIPGGTAGYFTAMLLKVSSVIYQEHSIHRFNTSLMERNLLTCQASVKGVPMTLMTSHLESTKEHSDERKRQLRTALKEMTAAEESRTVLFGGDLNIRDKEIQEIGGLPERVLDVWEVTGKRPEARYTWDLTRNDNLDWPHKFRPRCRFDRVYLRASRPPGIKPVYLELCGIERVPNHQKYPSDHWGILCHFDKT